MFLTDGPNIITGYGNVMRYTLPRLVDKGFETYIVSTHHSGLPIKTAEGYTILAGGYTPHGDATLFKHLKEVNPDVLITLRDIGIQLGYVRPVNLARKKFWKGKWIQYVPVDTAVTAHKKVWYPILNEADMVVTISNWGKKILSEQQGINSEVVPHGVDTNIYRPLPESEREELKSRYPDFVIGFVGRNQQRKMIAYLIKAFGIFSKDKFDVALLLHSDVKASHVTDGWDVDSIGLKYNCVNKISFTDKSKDLIEKSMTTDEEMNKIYNTFDIFALLTGGEGFGIPIIEAQAVGLPVVTTDTTTGRELVNNHGFLIPHEYSIVGLNGVEFVIPNSEKAAEAFEKLYQDEKLRKKLGKESREFVKENYNWKVVINRWVKIFENLETRNKPTYNPDLGILITKPLTY